MKWHVDSNPTVATIDSPVGCGTLRYDDLVTPATLRLAKHSIVFLTAVIVLATIIGISAIVARSAGYQHQPLPARSISSQ